MMSSMIVERRAAVVAARATCAMIVGAFVASAAASTAQAQNIERRGYDFTVTWSVAPDVPLSRGRLMLEQSEGFYTVTLNAQANLAVPRVDWRGVFATQGDVLGGSRSPQRFERSSIRPDLREDVVVSWGGDAQPRTTTRFVPETATVRREQVDEAQIVNVVDPLTFAVQILDRVSDTDGASCDVSVRTWDGARLSELQVTTERSVASSSVECRLTYRSIVGLREDNPWRSREERIDRIIRFEKRLGRWEPVRISISGTFVGLDSEFVTVLTRTTASAG